MNYTIDHNVLSSFKEYADYFLVKNTNAFININDTPLTLYTEQDKKVKTKNIYGSKYCQLNPYVEVSGVQASEVSVAGTPISEGDDGLVIDYLRGRAVFDGGYIATPVTLDTSIKEFNTFISSDPEEKIMLEVLDSKLPTLTTVDYIKDPYGFCVPNIFFKIDSTDNEPYCMGGPKKTNWKIRAIIFSDSEFLLAGAVSCFRDYFGKYFPLIGSANSPFNEYGGLKTAAWRYSDFLNDSALDICFIEKVLYTPVQPQSFTKNNINVYIGVCDFYVSNKRSNLV